MFRKFNEHSLFMSFTPSGREHIEPMVRFTKVSFRKGKKSVTTFYGELILFENQICLLMPSQEICELGGNQERDYESLWKTNASRGIKINKADYFMGKCPIRLYDPFRLASGVNACIVFFEKI